MAGLLATKAVSQADADKAAEALRVAEADLKRSNAAIAEAEGQIVVAEKNLLFRKEQLAFTEIHAPTTGSSSAATAIPVTCWCPARR